jgi:glycosyltransferase involved in cell wall biosynthesis
VAFIETSAHGGLLHYTVQLADAFAARGHTVDLLLARGNELRDARGPARRREVLVPHVRSAAAAPRNRIAYQARRVLIALRLVRSWVTIVWTIRRERYDVAVLAPDNSDPIATAAMLVLGRVRRRTRLALIVHNVRPFNRWGGEDLFHDRFAARLRRIYGGADLIVVHGEQSRKTYEALWPTRPIAVIPHGDERIFGDEPPPPAADERILFFGDWRKIKGLPVLMEAFDTLVERRPSARLTIAGTPAPADFDPDRVRRWSAAHGDAVTIVDHYIPLDEVRAIFATARVVVTPYIAGFQSGVIHLAQTMARAVVTSDCGDLPTAVDDSASGIVVPTGDASALADALEEVLRDTSRAAAMGAAGRARIDATASWAVVADALEAALTAPVEVLCS